MGPRRHSLAPFRLSLPFVLLACILLVSSLLLGVESHRRRYTQHTEHAHKHDIKEISKENGGHAPEKIVEDGSEQHQDVSYPAPEIIRGVNIGGWLVLEVRNYQTSKLNLDRCILSVRAERQSSFLNFPAVSCLMFCAGT
jgi:hypothetical protein